MTRQMTAVIIMAAVTYIPRVLPLAIIKNKLKSKFLRSFLYYVPFAVLGAMIFPSILYSTDNMLSAVVGMMVALILAYFEKGLLTVATSAILAVYIFELVI